MGRPFCMPRPTHSPRDLGVVALYKSLKSPEMGNHNSKIAAGV
jgi:hypothetical protein